MAVRALPTPPSGYVAAHHSSTMTTASPKVTTHGRTFMKGTSATATKIKYSGPMTMQGASTQSAVSPSVKMRSATPLTGEGFMTVRGGVNHSQTAYDGGFHVDSFGRLEVQFATTTPITVRNLLQVTPVLPSPVIIRGRPVLPYVVGRTTSPATTKGTYTLSAAPNPGDTANALPVPATWRWLASDVPGQDGAEFTTWPEHTGSGPQFLSNSSFAPTIIRLSHYDTSTRTNIDMGRCVNFYWRYGQHMAMTMDSANQMTSPKPFTVQFVLLAYPMNSRQFQHIWDAGNLVTDGNYTDPTSGTVETISDAVYENKDVNVNDNQGQNRCYFGLRPGKVETLFNNTPHVARLSNTTIVDARPFVYTVVFNAGAGSRIRIRGFGVNETIAADTKTSVVNNFILGRVQSRIGPTAGSHMSVWEMAYFNRALTEAEIVSNSHWLGGVYKFNKFH